MTPTAQDAILIDRQAEADRLREAIHRRESLLIWGPADAGKTALVRHVISELPAEFSHACFYIPGPTSVRDLARRLVTGLRNANDAQVLQALPEEARESRAFARWLRAQTSLRLRGIVYRGAGAGRYWIFVDHIPLLSHAFARMLRELMAMRKTPVYFLARGASPKEVGAAARLYWNDWLRLALGPLSESDARKLFDRCVQRFRLGSLELDDFRDETLRRSGCLPGAIVKMCALAAQPRYQFHDQVKIQLVHIDYLMSAKTVI